MTNGDRVTSSGSNESGIESRTIEVSKSSLIENRVSR